jgi:hypothetical protein
VGWPHTPLGRSGSRAPSSMHRTRERRRPSETGAHGACADDQRRRDDQRGRDDLEGHLSTFLLQSVWIFAWVAS